MPQVHGACRDAVAYAEWLLKLELNAVTDNPLIFVEGEGEDEKIEVMSGGNFHGEPLALAFDYLGDRSIRAGEYFRTADHAAYGRGVERACAARIF